MNAWSNIEVSPSDAEIIKINAFEVKLGRLPDEVRKIRELITRHEVCHFKYNQHIKNIKDSILNLELCVVPDKIGTSHIQHGEDAWKMDLTGRSFLGQQYVWAIKYWLEDTHRGEIPDTADKKLAQHVYEILGDKNEDKIRLVRLLLARLTWDWKSYEEFQHGGDYKELEFQICRMDICHYAFPSNFNLLLIGIGKMEPVENFEGCGSFDGNIQECIKKQLPVLNELFKSFYYNPDDKSQVKAWLTACLMKTLKEQVELSEPLIELSPGNV